MKLLKMMCFVLLGVLLSACSSTDSNDDISSAKKEKQVEFKIVKDEKFDRTEQREIRATTEATKEKDLKQITENIMEDYKGKGLDSVHLYIHAPDKETFGDLKAHSYIAYSQKGTAQVGVDDSNSYKIELEDVDDSANTAATESDDQSSKEWQDSFRKIALSEAGTYIELTEKKGKLTADRLQEHSKLIEMQADKMVNIEDKSQFKKLSELVLSDDLDGVKKMKADLEK